MLALKNTMIGLVTSTKMQKTIGITVRRTGLNKKYGKTFGFTSKYLCHDEHEVCTEGDEVRVKEGRPLSKKKRWTVIEIVKKAKNIDDY
jgi:small subunit ribosomal protein S17